MSPLKPLVVAVDVDDVCADLIGEWLLVRYADRAQHALQREDVTEWDVTKIVLPQWKGTVYDILNERDLYDCIQPVQGALAAVEFLRKAGHRVLFVTSCPRNSFDAKAEWLVRHGFLPDVKFLKDFIAASDKSVIMADVLVDDGAHNLATFPQWKVLVDRPHNRKAELTAAHWRVSSLLDAAHKIDAVLGRMVKTA